jgi:hypothetical protein
LPAPGSTVALARRRIGDTFAGTAETSRMPDLRWLVVMF